MRYAFAPMEGITGYIYRNAHKKWFGGADVYYSPFLSLGTEKGFSSRELQDIDPENNRTITLIPQILTNQADLFLRAAERLEALGYQEVNLNLGCPSGTVVAKKKGSGFLAYPKELQEFLEEIYQKTPISISIKTRIGKESPEEFEQLLFIFNQYPIKELIIHPRVQKEMYKNTPNWDVFDMARKESVNPVSYNGDLFCVEAYQTFRERFPDVESVMLGRGILQDPALFLKIRQTDALENSSEQKEKKEQKEQIKRLWEFHRQIYEGYQEIMSGDRNVLFKMKEIWFYLGESFPDSKKELKRIKKAEKKADYEAAVKVLFEIRELA